MLEELIATGFYVGRARYAPGTFGTLLGIPLVYLFAFKWWMVLTLGAALYFLALWSANYMIEMTKEKDPEEVVIDEVLGYFLSYMFVEPTIKTVFVGFITFRVLDIVKPYPINLFERLPKGHGVVADDAVSGLINAVILFFLFN
ncbi:MAG: phosphatidylglycerophosphatase A [Aquificaceae bacterium]